MRDQEFTLDESLQAQRAMRDELGLGAEMFDVSSFVGMVSDEIEQLRGKGWSDDAIADLVAASTGKRIGGPDIETHYVPPEQRQA